MYCFSDLQSLKSKCYSAWEIQKRQMEKSLEDVGAMVLSYINPLTFVEYFLGLKSNFTFGNLLC
jgi:hypothetical protein